MKGLEILGISPTQLLGVTQKVTPKLELTSETHCSQEKSAPIGVEPGNQQPKQLMSVGIR